MRRLQRESDGGSWTYGDRRFAPPLLAALALAVCLAFPVAAQATLLPTSGHSAKYKPSAFCPANQTCFSDAHWAVWTHRRAVARAIEELTCVGGSESQCPGSTRVRIVLNQPRDVCGGARYTRARWRPQPGSAFETTFFDVGIGGVGGRDAICIWSGG